MKTLNRILLIATALVCGLIAGCASLKKHENGAWAVITYGTIKAIEEAQTPSVRAARAARIRSIAEQVQQAAADESFALGVLEEVILHELSKLSLSQSDQFIADALVRIVTEEVRARFGPGLLDAEQRLQVSTVFQWIIDATHQFDLPAVET